VGLLALGLIDVPQFEQKRWPAGTGVPQLGQKRGGVWAIASLLKENYT
jgi:hypothetical protein